MNTTSKKITKIVSIVFLTVITTMLTITLVTKPWTKNIRIAIIMDTIGEEQFLLQAADKARELSGKLDFNLEILECVSSEHWEYNTQKASDENFDLIIGIGYQAVEQFALAAEEHPEIKYAIVDAKSGSSNVKSVEFNEGEGAYVLGVMIGTAFKDEEKIGYISSFKSQGTYKYRYQFEEGVLSVSPNTQILYEYIDSYSDVNAAYDKAISLKEQGVNFIMGGISSSANQGIYDAAIDCAKNGDPFYTTGLSIDQTNVDNPYIIGGLTKNTAVATEIIIYEFIYNEFENNVESLGIKENAMGIIHVTTRNANYLNKDIISDEVVSTAREIVNNIISGKIEIVTPEEK